MPLFDMPQEQLEVYQPDVAEPADFDNFWAQTLASARQYPLNARFERVETGLKLVDAYDVTFAGYGGQEIKGWYIRPANVTERLACVVQYIGYGGGRGSPLDWLLWANAGYAHFIMDTRGQGSAWLKGDTPDIPDGANPSFPGFMTQGILNPHTYYYRRVFTDAVRAVEAALSRDDIDPARLAVTGGSQGGGITLAVCALAADHVAVGMPSVPFLCHFQRAVTLIDTAPYSEIARYLSVHRAAQDTVFNTLSYFDGVNFARRIRARMLFSVGLMDTICPPSTVYAAYNAVSAPRQMRVYPFNNHEGGGMDFNAEMIRYLRDLWG